MPRSATQFKEGNNGSHEARKRNREKLLAEIPKCPAALKFMEAAWRRLGEKALKGEEKALFKMFDLVDKHHGPSAGRSKEADSLDRRPVSNDNLPPSCRKLREELDLNIAYVLQRYEMGLPCSEEEKLLARTTLAIRDSGMKSLAVKRYERIAKAWEKGMTEIAAEDGHAKEK